MERQVTAFIEFRVKLHHEDGLTEGDSTLNSFFFFPTISRPSFKGWAVYTVMEQSCKFLQHAMILEHHDTA